jgi:predicted ArsR family transcriptional regulator
MNGDEKIIEQKLAEQREQMERRHTRRLIALLNGLKKRLGPGVVGAVEDTMAERMREQWAEIAAREGSNTIEDLIRVLWEPGRAQGFEFTVERREDGVQMWCTRCPLHDQAQEIGEPDWMYHLTCCTDPHIVAGFNPQIGFRRTKTLMEGHDCCDHFYYMLE